MDGTYPSICRLCLAYCPIEVVVEGGRAVKVIGDRSGTPYDGYTCPKGRALPEQHAPANRLLHPLHRDGEDMSMITSRQAVGDIAVRLRAIIDKHGPEAVGFYIGTGVVSNPTGQGPGIAFMRAIGSDLVFSAATIDKPGANVSTALHGNWMAGAHRMEDADTWMVIGGNPVISKSNGAPPNNPGVRLKEALARGMKLIVVDPRRSETAKRATLHLQIRPGEDPALLAGMIHVILSENLHDQGFIDRHGEGLAQLRDAVAPFTPDYAAARAGVTKEDLIAAARMFAAGRIGGAVCSTGPSFSTHGNLSFYLALCLNTLCGRWARAGERAPFPNLLLPEYAPKAQAFAPYPALGSRVLAATGLHQNASGMPTGGLADQILSDGPDRIRALFCVGGNPVLAWPDQARTERALARLDLLVAFDYRMTATAEFADYVIPPPLTLEIPGNTQMVEWLKYIGVTRGMSVPWAQHSPAVVPRPEGSDLMDDGEFFFRLAQAMGLQLNLSYVSGSGPHLEVPTRTVALDMQAAPPTVDELLEIGCAGSRIPLEELKRHPHGRLFDTDAIRVKEADPDCDARLRLGDPMMMEELAEVLDADPQQGGDDRFPLRLICRRMNNFMNSVGQDLAVLRPAGQGNPFGLHPQDMSAHGLAPGAEVIVRSPDGEVRGQVHPDDSLRPGTLSMTHGFGTRLSGTGERSAAGASVACLIGVSDLDRVTGMPRYSAVPVSIAACLDHRAAATAETGAIKWGRE